jgi:hypothetical protein
MIALWMAYSIVVAGMVGAAAALIDRTAGSALRQRRWVWASAMLLSLGIPVWGMLRPPGRASESPAATTAERVPTSEEATTSLTARLAELVAQAQPRSLARFDKPFIIGWGIAVLLALASYGVGNWSLSHRRRSWRAAILDGEPVLLAPGVGPAVIGALRPQIVVPEWSLELPAEQRALMLEHERQHVRARDPLMLHGAALVALFMPWNLGAWWLNRRLRLAVELDCDARVLAAGRDVRAYGTLLLDVCSRRQRPTAVLAPALLERTSSLTRRILAMHPAPARYPRSRVALGVAAAMGLAVLACDIPTPEMLAPDGKNVASKRLYGKVAAVRSADGVVDGREIISRYFPSVARGEGGASILFVVRSATGEVVRTEVQPASALARTPNQQNGAGGQAQLSVRNRMAPALSPQPSRARASTGQVGTLERKLVQGIPGARMSPGSRGGRPRIPGTIGKLEPNDIESIEVVKHAAGVLAPNPVSMILIALKPGATIPTRARAP